MNKIQAVVQSHLASNPTSAASLFSDLEAVGVTGTAARLIVAQTGLQRHANRVASVLADAAAFAELTGIQGHYLMAMDVAGIGGSRFRNARSAKAGEELTGLTGEGTARAPGLNAPSKQSGPGSAWSSAVLEALACHSDASDALDPTDLMPQETDFGRALEPYRVWITSLAFQVLSGTWTAHPVAGEPSEWAALLNAWEDFDAPTTQWRVADDFGHDAAEFASHEEALAAVAAREAEILRVDGMYCGLRSLNIERFDRRTQKWVAVEPTAEEEK